MKRLPIARALCVTAVLAAAGCGSDDDNSSDSTTLGSGTATTVAGVTTVPAITATTLPSTSTTAATTITAGTGSSVAAPTTTVGSRVVTSPSDNVRLGDTGSGVEQIQQALKTAGYDIEADGQFGPVTDRAVRDFQSKHDLTVDGVVGPKTWEKLSGAGSGDTSTTGA